MEMQGNNDVGNPNNVTMRSMKMNMGGMKMYFHNQLPVQLLFPGWRIEDQNQLIGSCFAVIIFAVIYESLKCLRSHLLRKSVKASLHKSDVGNYGNVDFGYSRKSTKTKLLCKFHVLQSILQIVQTTIGMWLMLIFMTFHVWLALSVSLGAGIGYFLFARYSDNPLSHMEHCN